MLEPLDARHNESDYAAWTSSREHIKTTPGFIGDPAWLDLDMSLADNASAIGQHRKDFEARAGFAYTVLDPLTGEVIGCVYLYPPRRDGYDADVRSWVRADRADLDKPLHDLVRQWLAAAWPFRNPEYAAR
ncbi:MAG TPA: N-acetyltransferase [Streptosporangiaceae bacterium]|nr:N-acetyltransferase [Streptosporangiaceae bacterium]